MFLAIIQTRTQSKRFSNKSLQIIDNKTLLEHIINRLHKVVPLEANIIFSVGEKKPESIVTEAKKLQIPYYIGSEYNVLERFLQTITYYKKQKIFNTDNNLFIIRLTADNPFINFIELEKAIQYMKTTHKTIDYLTVKNLPLGTGFEIIAYKTLKQQLEYPLKKYHTEHVTAFIYTHRNIFKVKEINYISQLSIPDIKNKIRLTIDEPIDLDVAKKVYDYFKSNPYFTTEDILQLYQIKPEIFKINIHVQQKHWSSTE